MENKAKQKAVELIEQFMQPIDGLHKYPMCYDTAKQCALICCDEIIQSGILTPQLKRHYVNGYPPTIEELEFWQSVRTKIINHK